MSVELVQPAANGGAPTTTTAIIADGTETQHKNVLGLVRKHQPDMEEFGRVAFETRPLETAGGKQQTTVGVLNRDQALLLMTYMRNTTIVRGFKKNLIRAFTDMERRIATGAPAVPRTYAEALRAAADAVDQAAREAERADRAESRAWALGEWKRATEAGDGLKLTDFRDKYFSTVPKGQFFEHLYRGKWIRDERGMRVDADGRPKPGPNHMAPLRKANGLLYRHDGGTHAGKKRLQTRVKPDHELPLRDALIREGLTPNRHSTGLVLINDDVIKELS